MSFAQLFAASSVSVFILGISSIYDLVSRRVPNYLTGVAAMIGLVCPWFDICNVSVISSYLGGLVGLLLFLPPYSLNVMGAGDVKLMAAIGTLMGFPFIIQSSVMIVIFGAIIAILLLTVRRQLTSSIYRLAGVVTGSISVTSLANVHSDDSRTMPFAPAIFLGVLWTILQR